MVIDTDGNVSERASAKGSKPTKAVTPAAVEVSATASADNDDVTMSVSADEISELPEICVTGASVAAAATEWDARSFSNFAASKYDKNRKVGSEVDTVFVFGEAIAAPTSVEPDMEEA